MSAAIYDPGDFFDEGVEAGGGARPAYREVLRTLGSDPAGALASVDRVVAERGIEFGKDEAKQPFVLDPIPRIVEAADWAELEWGLAQRARALNALIADVYGERRIVSAGVLPQRVVDGAEYLEPEMTGLVGSNAATVIGFDLVRDREGRFLVLEDNTRTPSGMAYAAAARSVSEELLSEEVDCARPLDPVFGWLGKALRESGPDGVENPTVILLTDGPGNSAWYEHVELARRLGIPLIQPNDLITDKDELSYRGSDGALRRADVVLRRTDADRIAEPRRGTTWIARKLLGPLRSGKLRMTNMFGSGVADDKLVYAYVPEAIRFYLDEEPLVAQISTLDCANEEAFERVCTSPEDLVVKPRSESGGIGVVVGSQATGEELGACVDSVRANPHDYIAQEIVPFSSCPTVVGDAIEPRHVDLRAFAVCGRGGARVMPGGLTRVALREGSLVVNSSQGGGGKDTWVLR
ncbi:MAG: circularly permuted type 2 ATP-grasp protein [Actinomycetota bacterium]|nr:circularly permuted type 2 ATP-grasp protein [Actinomycetota bacterium]